jgi:hypothetical protein
MLHPQATRHHKDGEDRFGRILSHLVSIGTICAIVGGLYGYFSSRHDVRVEKTFNFYKTFRSEPLRKDWALLISRWNGSADKAKPLLDAQKYDELAALVVTLVNDDSGRQAFGHVVDFFDEFYSCVEHSLCDRNSGVALLKDPADEFVEPYGAYISYLRKKYGNNTIGSGVYNVRSMSMEWTLF